MARETFCKFHNKGGAMRIKTLKTLLAGLLLTAPLCRAQISPPTGFRPTFPIPPPVSGNGPRASTPLNGPLDPQNWPAVAEAITPEIQALARGLENDPLRIYNYVQGHIRYVLYWGSKKGAQLTLLDKGGNDFDQ